MSQLTSCLLSQSNSSFRIINSAAQEKSSLPCWARDGLPSHHGAGEGQREGLYPCWQGGEDGEGYNAGMESWDFNAAAARWEAATELQG